MKRQKITYWMATACFSVWMSFNAYFYLTADEAKRICVHLGFPDYFRVELAFAKIAGVLALLLPTARRSVKEWAYAGFAITVLSGSIAHWCSGDGIASGMSALSALALLTVSYLGYRQLKINPR